MPTESFCDWIPDNVLLFDSASDIILVVDVSGRILSANQTALRQLGRSPERLIGEHVSAVHAQNPSAELERAIGTALSVGSDACTLPLLTSNGAAIPVETKWYRTSIRGSTVLVAVARDLRAQRHADTLAYVERDLGVALAATTDLHTALEFIVDAALKVTGYDAGGFYLIDPRTGELDLAVHRGLSNEFAESVRHFDAHSPEARLVMAGRSVHGIYPQLLATLGIDLDQPRAREGLQTLSIVPVLTGDEVFGSLQLASHRPDDISEQAREALEGLATRAASAIQRMRAEEALASANRYFRLLLENTSDIVSHVGPDGVIVYEAPAVARISGFTPEEIVGRSAFELMHPDDVAGALRVFDEVLRHPGETYPVQARYRRKDDSYCHLEGIALALPSESSVRGVIINAHDVTDRKQWEEALLRERDTIRSILESSPLPILIMNLEGVVTDCNSAGCEELDCSSKQELVGAKGCSFVAEPDRERAQLVPQVVLEQGVSRNVEFRMLTRLGRVYPADVSAAVLRDGKQSPVGFVCTVQDTSERKRMEADLRHAYKMESLGQLAGGIAHDFNNLLTAIKSYASFLLTSVESIPNAASDVEEILAATERAENLTRQLLAFSRRQVIQPRSTRPQPAAHRHGAHARTSHRRARTHRAANRLGARAGRGRPRADRASPAQSRAQCARRHARGRDRHHRAIRRRAA